MAYETNFEIVYHLVNHNSKHTVGVEFGQKFLRVNDKVVKLQIWDTAG